MELPRTVIVRQGPLEYRSYQLGSANRQQLFDLLSRRVLQPDQFSEEGQNPLSFESFGSLLPFLMNSVGSGELFEPGMTYEQLAHLQDVPTPSRHVHSFPDRKFAKNSSEKNAPCECSICLSEYSDGELVKTLPCTHQFHSACIDTWLSSNNKCPVCKCNVDKLVK